jgi:hypothetical protein
MISGKVSDNIPCITYNHQNIYKLHNLKFKPGVGNKNSITQSRKNKIVHNRKLFCLITLLLNNLEK